MNKKGKTDTASLIIVRKNNSLVDLKKKEDNHSSSVFFIDSKNNYSFRIKDEKNFFSKFSKNLEALKKIKMNQKERVSYSNKTLRSNITYEDNNENVKFKNTNKEMMIQNTPTQIIDSINLPGNFLSEKLKIDPIKKENLQPESDTKLKEDKYPHVIDKNEGKVKNYRETHTIKNSENLNLKDNIIEYNSKFFKKIRTDINLMKSSKNLEMMSNDISPNSEEFSKDKSNKSIDFSVEKRDYHTENKFTNARTNQDLIDDSLIDNKVVVSKKLNNVENILRSADNVTSSVGKSTFSYRICLICDNYIVIQNIFIPSCEHVFCIKCLKSFLEDKIEQGEVNMKCPIYKCTIQIMMETLRLIVSEKHYENIKNKPIAVINNDNFPKSPRFKSLNPHHTVIETVKVYMKKHVIHINTSESMFLYTKNKDHFCIHCFEPTLFGKNGNKYVKCLNCLISICKFCLKKYSYDHFNKTNPNHCRVYFRTKNKQIITKESYLAKFFHLIFVHIISYIFLFCGIFYIVKCLLKTILNLKGENSILLLVVKNILFYSLLVSFLAFQLFLFVFLIPFFPVFLSIFNN